MRMPLSEFILSGDIKFIVAFIIFSTIAIYHFIGKLKAKKSEENQVLAIEHNAKINSAAFWVLILSVLSLLLGLMHSFYFIGKAGGIAPDHIFQGVSYALITPILGLGVYIICKILSKTFNPVIVKS